MGSSQFRLGPNKVGVFGFFQPFADGLKLFLKENLYIFSANKFLYRNISFLIFFLIIIFWLCFIFKFLDFFNFRVIYVILVSGRGIYGIFIRGWASNCAYALLGSYRRVSQVISYEVRFFFLLILIFLSIKNYRLILFFSKNRGSHYFIWGGGIFFFIWFMVVLAELNRAPFDFAERESELVSGFNVEFGSLKFAFLFLSEYGNIIFMCYLTMNLFFCRHAFILVLLITIILVRRCYPRFRYDLLIFLNWKIFLPFILFWFLIFYILVYV